MTKPSLLTLGAIFVIAMVWGALTKPLFHLPDAQANETIPMSSLWEPPGPDSLTPALLRFLPKSITLKNQTLAFDRFKLEGMSATLNFIATDDGLGVRLTNGVIASVSLEGSDSAAPLLFQGVSFNGKLLLGKDLKHWTFSEFHMDIPPRGRISLEGEYNAQRGSLRGFVKCRELDLSRAMAQLLNFPTDFHFAFLMDEASIQWEQKPGGPILWQGNMHASNIDFHSADFDRAGENLVAGLQFSGRSEPNTDSHHFQLHFQLKEGECLFNTFYFNLAQTPFSFSLDGIGRKSPSPMLRINEFRTALHSVLQLRCEGSLDMGRDEIRTDLEITADLQPMGPVVSKFIREPFAQSHPEIEGMSLDGQWGGLVRINGPFSNPGIKGRIQIHDGSLSHEPQGLEIKGISVSLPFQLGPSPQANSTQAGDTEKGRIMVLSLHTPLLRLGPMELGLQALPNGYRLEGSARIDAEKGFLEIIALELHDLLSPQRTGSLILRVSQLGLDNLMEALFTRSLAASLDASRLEILLHENDLEGSGALYLNTFAGKVTIEQFGVRQLSSPYRAYRLDADWKDLDLDKLTGLTDFGRVTGHVEGHIEGLEIVQGTPIAFDLSLRSTPKKRAVRKISLTAVENVTEISGGGSPFRGMGGVMASLFKTFSYSKLGITCNLKNDFFTIRGTVVEDGTEYLLKRGILGGINIINQNPNNRISWNDMLRRIERVQRDPSAGMEQ